MNDIPTAKIKMMKGSIRVLVDGLLGFIPIIGLGFALTALWISSRVRRQEKQFWNPAKPYRVIGVVCAAVSAIVWSGVLIFVFGNLLLSLLGG
jgi:branched-subunit amino acid transport protein